MKNKISLISGLICTLIGVITLLMNVTVTSWSFYRFGKINSGGILFVILILSIIYLIARRNKTGIFLVAGSIGLMLLSLIMGINMYIGHLSAFTMVLIIGLIGVGLGLIVKAFL